MSAKVQAVQDVFLSYMRKNKVPVTVFLINGVRLQGIIDWFDRFSVLLRRDRHSQLVFKHTISTIIPMAQVQLLDGERSSQQARSPHVTGGRS
jgi:host factor-I protein